MLICDASGVKGAVGQSLNDQSQYANCKSTKKQYILVGMVLVLYSHATYVINTLYGEISRLSKDICFFFSKECELPTIRFIFPRFPRSFESIKYLCRLCRTICVCLNLFTRALFPIYRRGGEEAWT